MSQPEKLTASEKGVILKSCLSPRISPRHSDGALPGHSDSALMSSMKSESDSPNRKKLLLHKVVSFSELSEFFAALHTVEEVWGIRADSCVVDMIPEDEEIDRKGITRVDFTSIDKTSVAAEVVPANQGEKAFSMDLVFQKLLDLQLSQENGKDPQDGHRSDLQKYVSTNEPISISMASKLALEADSSTNSDKSNSGNNTEAHSNNASTKIGVDAIIDHSADSSGESPESSLSPNDVSVSAPSITTTTTTTIAITTTTTNNQEMVEGTSLSPPISSSFSSSTIQLSNWNARYGAQKAANNSVDVVPNLLLHEALNKPQLPSDTTQDPLETSLPVEEPPIKKKKSVRMHFADDVDDGAVEKKNPIIHQPIDPTPVLLSAAISSSAPSSSSFNNIKSASFQVSESNQNDSGNANKG